MKEIRLAFRSHISLCAHFLPQRGPVELLQGPGRCYEGMESRLSLSAPRYCLTQSTVLYCSGPAFKNCTTAYNCYYSLGTGKHSKHLEGWSLRLNGDYLLNTTFPQFLYMAHGSMSLSLGRSVLGSRT